LHHRLLANRNDNDVVGDEPSFTGNDQEHRNAFRSILVASMQQVHDSNNAVCVFMQSAAAWRG
jgi:enolase